MNKTPKISSYDVVIMGGGPGGATLAALLKRKTKLSVALFEKESFPRDHIGESFSHRVVHPLAESGALDKVIWSGCAIQKFGGFYAWDPAGPSTTFFDHADYRADGIKRWAMHVDRASFDKVLLDHARSCGADVFERASVERYEYSDAGGVAHLADGTAVRCRLFVEASGRRNNLLCRGGKRSLSTFKNMAIWGHVLGGRSAQQAEGSWNIFRQENLSPIGCFAFEDGWFWYIPIPKIIDGSRVVCHSLGLVTNPDVLKQKGREYLDYDYLLATAKKVPVLGELIDDVVPLREDLNVATNYSMINDAITNYDSRGILLGDAAFFVDPLFSSGVAFSLNQALAACALIRDTLGDEHPESVIKDLWQDYDYSLRRLAHTYALSIDQWYFAISKIYPNSTYWNQGRFVSDDRFRSNVFQSLVDTSLTPDLMQVLTRGTGEVQKVEAEGPISSVKELIFSAQPQDDEVIGLESSAYVRESWTYRIPQLYPETPENREEVEKVRLFWSNPQLYSNCLPKPYQAPEPCLKFCLQSENGLQEVPVPRDIGKALVTLLNAQVCTYGELIDQLGDAARPHLVKLFLSGALVRSAADLKQAS